jgi:membrane protease YdiL (CAAX protease family)
MSRRADESGQRDEGERAEERDPQGGLTTKRRRTARAIVVAGGLGLAGPAVAAVLLFTAGIALGVLGVSLSPLVAIAVTLVLTQIIGFGGVILGYAYYRGYTAETLGIRIPSGRELGLTVVGGVGALALALLAAIVLQALAIEGASNQAAEVGAQNPAVFLLLIPAAFLVIGPCEEGLYRGIVQGRLREAVGPAPAITIAAALFAAVHVVALSGPSSARLVTIALLLIPGLVFGVAYEYTGNLVVVAGMHAVYDAIIFGMLYLVFA